jgi:tetratricopeptide (TPR) repeat protein
MIFISYRKADTQAVVDHLAEKLKSVFGATAVFKDDRDLRAGERWPDRLEQEVLARAVLLAVIGPNWLTALDDDGRRRLDDPGDWVRREISTALNHGRRVIVLLVQSARMPTKRGLPADCPLQKLPDLQALPLRCGADFETDLAKLIEELRAVLPAAPPAAPASVTATWAGPTPRPLPPRPPVCFGRAAPLAELLDTLLPAKPDAKVPATPVGGVGGIGKSTFVLTALHDERVHARYGDRRHFVRLDGATNRSAVAAAVAESVGLPLGEALEARLLDFLGRGGPRLLVLDNAETPLLADDRTETEELLRALAGVPSLAVVATLRGAYPLGPGWRLPLELRRLDDVAARQAFLAGTSGLFADDPGLDDLLRELDGWPLAVTLLAYQARFYADLQELADGWRKKRAALLTKGVKRREADLGASIEMSLGCPHLTGGARRLLALLGILPDGICRADLAELVPPDGAEAAAALRRVGGLAFDEGPRLRVLAPVREYLAEHFPTQVADCERAVVFYCRRAAVEGQRVGYEGGADASARVAAETGNCVAMVRLGLKAADPEPAFKGAFGLAGFSRFSGVDLSAILLEAELAARDAGNRQRQGDCIQRRGHLALARSEYDEARRCFQEARALYERVGSVKGEAICILRLGDIALVRSGYAEAQRCYEEARALFGRLGSVIGEVDCIRGLGYLALNRSEQAKAQRCYEEARLLLQGDNYEDAGLLVTGTQATSSAREFGRIRSIQALGDLALSRSEHEEARRCYEEARPLYQRIGYILGEANCLKGLGELALRGCDHVEARRCYEAAQPLYQRVGDVLGEADCLQGLGSLAHNEGNGALARNLYERALALYQRIPNPFFLGLTHRLLARSSEAAEREGHVQAARAAWTGIDRTDLVAELDQEFGPTLDSSIR